MEGEVDLAGGRAPLARGRGQDDRCVDGGAVVVVQLQHLLDRDAVGGGQLEIVEQGRVDVDKRRLAEEQAGRLALVAELNALAAFPAGIEEIGPCPGSGCVRPNTSIQADFNLGILFAF